MKRSLSRLGAVAIAALLAGSAACATTPRAAPISNIVGDSTPGASILAVGRRVADWQLAHMTDFSYVATFKASTEDPTDWIQAAFFIGLTEFADATGDPRYAEALIDHGRAQGWSYGDRPRHADEDAIGQVWVWAAERVEGDERAARLAPTLARFAPVLAAPSDVSMIFGEEDKERPCQVRWCWSDALFMAPPLWAQTSRLTGDPRYLNHMDREYRATVDALFDREEGLFYRDSRFLTRRGPTGAKIFWSRGNGWAYSGLARVIDRLPQGDPRRSYYVDLYRAMTVAVLRTQGAEGYWPVSLLEPGGPPETSGTGFFVHGLAWGLNRGLLTEAEAGPAVRRGWAAMERAVQPDGRLGWVQQVGYAPDRVSQTDTQLYGVGAMLLAASEVSRLPR